MKQLFYVLTVLAALPIHWTKAAESTTGVTECVHLELRAKTAKKPYNTARYWQLSVAPENEGDFINLFEKLMPVFQKEVELGQYHWWAMFKAHENELGANYLVSVGSDSIYINNSEPFQKLWRDNIITREEWVQTWSSILDIVKFQGSFVVSLNDYILNDVDEPRWPVDMKKILLTVGYITTAEENEMHMIKMIEDFWRERYQKRFELDGSLIGWNALKVEGNEKAFANANLITTMVQRTDRLPTELQLNEINSSLPKIPNGYFDQLPVKNLNELREFKQVKYDLVLVTDGSKSMKNKFLNEITGTWVHQNKDGSYRKKVMTRNTEQTTFFDKNNAIVEKRDPWPYRVEVIHGQPRFTVYSPNGSTWNAAVNLINGQWFEQHRAKFNGVWTATDPKVYWTYDKED